jgi:hypothetical protein
MTSRATNAFTQRLSQILDLPHWMLLAAVTVISFLYSGYSPIFNNNIYHIPLLLESYDLPQFSGDPFIQSLRHFSSGFWILFAGAGHVVGVKLFLTIGLVVTRFAFFGAALHLAGSLGLRDRRTLNLFLLLLCVSPWVYGHMAGDGGILLNYFTHSELANASLLMGLSLALRQRYGAAAIATCLTFFLNAFMAVWMVPPLALLAGYQLVTGQIAFRRLLVPAVIGLVAGSPLLILPLHNILQNPEIGGVSVFSYQQYLWDFFPRHFFLWSLPPRNLAVASVQTLVLLLSVRLLGASSRAVLMVALGMLSVLALGVLAALVTDSRMILNLHLIRSFVMIAMLLAVIVAVVAARWILDPAESPRKALGLGLAAAMASGKVGLLIALALFLIDLSKTPPAVNSLLASRKARVYVSCLLGFCLVAGLLGSGIKQWAFQQDTVMQERWEKIGRWANVATPAEAVFQVPTESALGFSLTSQRQLWFDGKYGAAVMWSPSYYPIWKERHAIPFDRSMIDRKPAGMDFLAMPCDDTVTQLPVHREDGICVYKLT